jgi:DNA-binding transcriptional regulator YiaG
MTVPIYLTPAHCRAARAWLGWTQDELAAKAGINVSTVKSYESAQRTPHRGSLTLLTMAFTQAGIAITPHGIASFSGSEGLAGKC